MRKSVQKKSCGEDPVGRQGKSLVFPMQTGENMIDYPHDHRSFPADVFCEKRKKRQININS